MNFNFRIKNVKCTPVTIYLIQRLLLHFPTDFDNFILIDEALKYEATVTNRMKIEYYIFELFLIITFLVIWILEEGIYL